MRTALTVLRRLVLIAALVAIVLGVGDRDAPATDRLPELDVVVVVDRTTSMSAQDDPAGSRIAAATRDLVAFAQQLRSARFTVVTVGGQARVALPPTSDRAAFEDVVSRLAVEAADAGIGSASDRAVPTVTTVLDDEDEDDTGGTDVPRIPVLVYVGDGEDTGPDAEQTEAAFGALRDRFTDALVLGYGTEAGGTMPLVLTDSKPDPAAPVVLLPDPATGEPAVSHADPARLTAIATAVGGTYLAPAAPEDATAAADALQTSAYADLPPVEPARQVGWIWGLFVLMIALVELRAGWRTWWAARRAVVVR